MAHQIGVVRNASHLKGKFSQIVAEASNKESVFRKIQLVKLKAEPKLS